MRSNYCLIKRNVERVRRLVVRATAEAGSGHPGGSFSMAEIMGVLYWGRLRHDPARPLDPGRDRLVLSKGHAAPGLFASLAVAGYIPEGEVGTLRSLGSRLQGHPDLKCPGVEFCGGSLGIGLSFSLGAALAMRMDGLPGRVYTVMGDGETDEGQVWEAAMAAAKYRADNLTVIMDRNFIQQDSYTERVMPLDEELIGEDLSEMWSDASRWRTGDKWRSFGWNVIEVDGHRIEQVDDALERAARARGAPTIIIARTVKGKAVEHMEDNPQWHGKAPSKEMAPVIYEELGCQFAVAPSITAGDMSNLEGEVKRCVHARADLIHLDVMDGRFVPARTFGADAVRRLRPLTVLPFDTHLMVEDPAGCAREFAEAGSDIVTVHAEACDEASFGEAADRVRAAGAGVGLAVNPGTELPGWAGRFAAGLDQVIVMSVEPGRSGQSYIESSHEKTRRVLSALRAEGFGGVVEADGGVTAANVGACLEDGARAFVGGSAIVGAPDAREAIRGFRAAALEARRRMLLAEAHRRGGPGLAARWAGLHSVGRKREQLERIAAESGYA